MHKATSRGQCRIDWRCGDIRLEAQKAAPSVYERYANRRSGRHHIQAALTEATYHIEHHGVDINIRTTRGVRQGALGDLC